MSRRKPSLSRSQSRGRSYVGRAAAPARTRPRSPTGRTRAPSSNSVRSSSSARCSWAGRSRAEAAPGDEVGAGRDCRRGVDLQQRQPVDDREQVRRPRASSSCARIAMRRASCLVSACTPKRLRHRATEKAMPGSGDPKARGARRKAAAVSLSTDAPRTAPSRRRLRTGRDPAGPTRCRAGSQRGSTRRRRPRSS